jgi:hypothetical protein
MKYMILVPLAFVVSGEQGCHPDFYHTCVDVTVCETGFRLVGARVRAPDAYIDGFTGPDGEICDDETGYLRAFTVDVDKPGFEPKHAAFNPTAAATNGRAYRAAVCLDPISAATCDGGAPGAAGSCSE